jgi:3-hydroxymyristoyl/3-hydroxydecanoyl-(acyl carrier protein) dehydratase
MNDFSIDIWVDPALPFFKGHFPSHSILPGVVLLQWIQEKFEESQGSAKLNILKSAKFIQPIYPNDTISIQWKCSHLSLSATIVKNNQICTKAEFLIHE